MSDPDHRPEFDSTSSDPGLAAEADPPEPAERAEPADARVAEAVDRLDELPAKDPAEHVEIYERVHGELHDALTDAADERTADDAAEEGSGTDQDAGSGGPPP